MHSPKGSWPGAQSSMRPLSHHVLLKCAVKTHSPIGGSRSQWSAAGTHAGRHASSTAEWSIESNEHAWPTAVTS